MPASQSKTKMRKKTLGIIKSFAIDKRPTMSVNIQSFRDDQNNIEGVTIMLIGTNPKLRQTVMAEIMDAVKCLLGEESSSP